ncbi:hypothetical protein P8T57_12805 [Thalassospira sp. SN3W]|uniref:hypothetical protein n=1 Tax=Thalassospira sp. SN3W TaxID=3035476 RepID=UPI00311B192A
MSFEEKLLTISFDDQEAIRLAITNHETFEIGGCQGRMSEAVLFAERAIGALGMTSRVYTKGRLGMAIPVAGLAIIAAHNLATLNPHYEIVKRPIDGFVRLVYVKDLPDFSDHISDVYQKATVTTSQVFEAVGQTWDQHVPNRDIIVNIVRNSIPRVTLFRKFTTRTVDGGTESSVTIIEQGAENSDLPNAAARILELEQHLENAANIYAEHNKSIEFVMCLFAVGAAIAACDGHFDDEEKDSLTEFVLGASAITAPGRLQSGLEKLIQNPPSFADAMIFVGKLDKAVWPIIDDIITVVSEADGQISEEEKIFIEKWQAYKFCHA